MVNAWTIHVKDYASRNGLSYMCAMTEPACSAEYRAKKGLPPKPPAPKPPKPPAPKPPKPPAPKPPKPKPPKTPPNKSPKTPETFSGMTDYSKSSKGSPESSPMYDVLDTPMENMLDSPNEIAVKLIDEYTSFASLLRGDNELASSILSPSQLKLVKKIVTKYEKLIDKMSDFLDEAVPEEAYEQSVETVMDRIESVLGIVIDNPPRLRPDWTAFVKKNYEDLAERVNRIVGLSPVSPLTPAPSPMPKNLLQQFEGERPTAKKSKAVGKTKEERIQEMKERISKMAPITPMSPESPQTPKFKKPSPKKSQKMSPAMKALASPKMVPITPMSPESPQSPKIKKASPKKAEKMSPTMKSLASPIMPSRPFAPSPPSPQFRGRQEMSPSSPTSSPTPPKKARLARLTPLPSPTVVKKKSKKYVSPKIVDIKVLTKKSEFNSASVANLVHFLKPFFNEKEINQIKKLPHEVIKAIAFLIKGFDLNPAIASKIVGNEGAVDYFFKKRKK